jgi:hypothetical protein
MKSLLRPSAALAIQVTRAERTTVKKIHRLWLPGLGRFALVRDNGEARIASGLVACTHLEALVYHKGRLEDVLDLGSGVITTYFANQLVSTATTPANNPLATFKYHDSGTGTTSASDTQTALVTQAGPSTRATGTLSNAQTADGTNHTAKLLNSGTINYTSSLAIQEWGLFDQAAQGGNMADRRTFSAINVASGDAITFNWTVSLPSNG